ncbi:uncharacterized protein [Melopsittacus undulatus]|uniref:uncharacterized protein n=1 Tax=Melopsittacus undulatus TaxID=13146 RepID=UPI00146BFF47|nr:uncharacterized protein LOC117438334 [Melopsittacus undulatus]
MDTEGRPGPRPADRQSLGCPRLLDPLTMSPLGSPVLARLPTHPVAALEGDHGLREGGGGPAEGSGGPGRGRRVRFRLPPTAIALPSVHEEEQVFYRRLEALVTPGPGGFGPLFAADGWSDLTEDRLLRKRVVRDGQDGLRPRPGQEVSVKVLGALEDGALVERDPRLTFVPGYGDVVQALELGVPTMQPGEVAFFLAAFPYGYGRPGR